MESVPVPSQLQKKGPRGVRLRDIAELAGVHLTTVSSVLSPRPGNHTRVSQKTADRILELAKQLNYRPDHHAQMMRKKKSGVIAVIEFGRSEIHSQRTTDLAHAMQRHEYRSLIVNPLWYDETQTKSALQAALDYVMNSRPEGIILLTPTVRISRRQIFEIQDSGIPCVAFNGIHFPGVPQVRSDACSGAEAMTSHLIGLGHQRLAFMGSWGTAARDENTCWPTLERMRGFESAIRRCGGQLVDGVEALNNVPQSAGLTGAMIVPEETKPHLADTLTGYRIARSILQSGAKPSVLVCLSDRYAVGAMRACFEAGLQVPRDIAVTGFGGEKDVQFLCPALTTIDTLAPSSAEVAFDLLLQMIRNERPLVDDTLIKTSVDLVVRESCGSTRPHIIDGR